MPGKTVYSQRMSRAPRSIVRCIREAMNISSSASVSIASHKDRGPYVRVSD